MPAPKSGLLRRSLQLLAFYFVLLWLGSMLLVGNVACLPLALLPARWRVPLMQWLISRTVGLFLYGCATFGLMHLDLRDLDTLNDRHGWLLVANHPSMIDVFLVLSRVKNAACLMKSGIGYNVFLAAGARLAGYISNRDGQELLRDAAAAMRSGQTVLAFPEGTRTTQQPLNELKPGAALIARMAHAPVQMILLTTNTPYLSKGWKIWRPPTFPMIFRARLGPSLQPPQSTREATRHLQALFRQTIPCSIDPDLQP